MTPDSTPLDRLDALERVTMGSDLRAAVAATEDLQPLLFSRNHLRALIDTANAARSVYLGFTCSQDPMDVDERLERLKEALSPLLFPTDEKDTRP